MYNDNHCYDVVTLQYYSKIYENTAVYELFTDDNTVEEVKK